MLYSALVKSLYPILIPTLAPTLIPTLIPALIPNLTPALTPALIPTLIPTLTIKPAVHVRLKRYKMVRWLSSEGSITPATITLRHRAATTRDSAQFLNQLYSPMPDHSITIVTGSKASNEKQTPFSVRIDAISFSTMIISACPTMHSDDDVGVGADPIPWSILFPSVDHGTGMWLLSQALPYTTVLDTGLGTYPPPNPSLTVTLFTTLIGVCRP